MSLFNVLYDLNTAFVDCDIDPGAVGIVLKRDDFERMRDAVKLENPGTDWNKGESFFYAGLTFVDAGSFVWARKH